MKKATVTAYYHGHKVTGFLPSKIVNGKTIVRYSDIQMMFITQHGIMIDQHDTFSIG